MSKGNYNRDMVLTCWVSCIHPSADLRSKSELVLVKKLKNPGGRDPDLWWTISSSLSYCCSAWSQTLNYRVVPHRQRQSWWYGQLKGYKVWESQGHRRNTSRTPTSVSCWQMGTSKLGLCEEISIVFDTIVACLLGPISSLGLERISPTDNHGLSVQVSG